MGKRRKSRELAVQFLYQVDVLGSGKWQESLNDFWGDKNEADDVKEYSNRLIMKVLKMQEKIDEQLVKYTKNWDIKRIAIVDRNVLRTAICELLYMEDIPPIVSINEAIDIAKKYGTEDSGKFVNGILDKLRKTLINNNETGHKKEK